MSRQLQAIKRRLLASKIALAFLLIILVATVAIVRDLGGPAKGSIDPPDGNQVSGQVQAVSYSRFRGKFISFSFSQAYRLEKASDLPPGIPEAYRLISKSTPTNPSRTIAVNVYQLAGSGLDQVSAYRQRQISPSTYKRSLKTIADQQYVFFEKSDGSELIGFLDAGVKALSVSLSGNVTNPQAKPDYWRVAKSLKWD